MWNRSEPLKKFKKEENAKFYKPGRSVYGSIPISKSKY